MHPGSVPCSHHCSDCGGGNLVSGKDEDLRGNEGPSACKGCCSPLNVCCHPLKSRVNIEHSRLQILHIEFRFFSWFVFCKAWLIQWWFLSHVHSVCLVSHISLLIVLLLLINSNFIIISYVLGILSSMILCSRRYCDFPFRASSPCADEMDHWLRWCYVSEKFMCAY